MKRVFRDMMSTVEGGETPEIGGDEVLLVDVGCLVW